MKNIVDHYATKFLDRQCKLVDARFFHSYEGASRIQQIVASDAIEEMS